MKLSESGLNEYFTKSGEITTDNEFLISPPEFVFGRKITRVVRNRADTLEADIYSLGVILVLLLKGKVKNFSKTPKVMEKQKIREMISEIDFIFVDFSWKKSKESVKIIFDKDLDRDLVSILRGMLQRIPEKRFDISRIKKHKWLKSVQN